MRVGKHSSSLVISGILLGITSGCAHVGLSAIPQTREGYNKALSSSDNEQFLLNVVRMHYGQTPYFVNVDNMVTQSTLRTGSGVDSQLSNAATSTSTSGLFWRASPVVEFTQTPTITYSPLQGTQFVSGMLTPIDTGKLSLLLQSGWSTSAVLKLTIDKIGSLSNGSVALNSQISRVPQQQEFNTFVDLLDKLEAEDKVTYAATKYNDNPALVINVFDDQTASKLAGALHLKHAYHQLIFSRAVVQDSSVPENILNIQTRSFFAMLNFLSKGVVASEDEHDADNGVKTKIESGSFVYNLNALTKNLFLVSTSDSEPEKAAVKISFDDKWYFIPNNDRVSKATLVLLRMVYSLQVGEVKANLPLITIPVK